MDVKICSLRDTSFPVLNL
ncbi:unnamed protein product [Nezara viridula]|uniref:Uncharacterized protein n=1 Tax=Nezara viridula TaxID=85310 RepID=A0A9P0E4P9_NEZVI|nr:unnamed protein product [Nezara viridula]